MDFVGPPARPTNVPKATVQKIISEVLAAKPEAGGESQGASMSFAKETRDLLIECCVEFITMLTSEANDIAEKDAKKTIACEHITKALQDLGFGEYVPELLAVADNFKSSQAVSVHIRVHLWDEREADSWYRRARRSSQRSSRAACRTRSSYGRRRSFSGLRGRSTPLRRLVRPDDRIG